MPVVNLLFVDNKLYALDTKFDNKMHNFNLNFYLYYHYNRYHY